MSDVQPVTFTNGGNTLPLPTAVGQKAGLILPTVRKVMNIPSGATATIEGEAIANDYVFEEGDQVLFYKPSGDKGRD